MVAVNFLNIHTVLSFKIVFDSISAFLLSAALLFVKYIVARWAADKAVEEFDGEVTKWYHKYPREVAMLLHYHRKATGKGHQHPNPLICEDEHCKIFQLP